MRFRRDARFVVLFAVSSVVWASALWFARRRPVDSSLYQQSRVGLSASEVSNMVDSLLYQQSRVAPSAREEAGASARTSGARFVAPRPRVLGKGRSSGRVYWDVRDSLGNVRRYYARTNAVELATVFRTMLLDMRDAEAAFMVENGSADSLE